MGLAYVAPIGLQNLFVIHGALTGPRIRAFFIASIVTAFDISLALACFFGAGAVMEHWLWARAAVLGLGSLMVMRIGAGLLRAAHVKISEEKERKPLYRMALSAFVVTWCNPQALIDGTLMLGAFYASLPAGGALPFIAGTAAASFLWFHGLTGVLLLFEGCLRPGFLIAVNRLCGAVILFYGGKLFWNFVELFLK